MTSLDLVDVLTRKGRRTTATTMTSAIENLTTTTTTATTTALALNEMDHGRAHVIAGTIIMVLGVFGLAMNISTILKMLYNRAWRTAFGNLCVSHLSADTLVLLIFVFWCAPLAILKDPAYGLTLWNNLVGLVSLASWEASIYAQFFIAANRLCAIARPLSYKRLFSTKNTAFMIVVIWCLACCHGVVLSFPSCAFTFDSTTYTWGFSTEPCGSAYATYIDLILGLVMLGIIASMDLTTFFFLRRQHRLMERQGVQQTDDAKRNRHQERKFYIQAVILGSMFAITLVFFHLLSLVFTDPWGGFVCTTIMWEVSHVGNGSQRRVPSTVVWKAEKQMEEFGGHGTNYDTEHEKQRYKDDTSGVMTAISTVAYC